jgi:hypothetical protein
VQGQSNRILAVRFRGLAGAGLRFRVLKSGRFRLYAAAAAMAEHEILEPDGAGRTCLRLSSYASWTWRPGPAATVVHTTYLQPLASVLRDFRVSSQTDLKFRVGAGLSAGLSYTWAYDTRPPAGVVRGTQALRHLLSYDFGR